MKVLHISEHYAPVGGAETYLIGVLDELAHRGCQNVVIYQQEHPRTLRGGERLAYCVPRDSGNAASDSSIERVRGIIQGEDPDVIYLHLVYDPAIIELAASCKPTVAYIHGFQPCCPGLGKYFRRTDTICTLPFSPVSCALNIYLRRCAWARRPDSVYRVIRTTALQQKAYRQVNRLLVASTYMKNLLVQNGFDPGRIELLPLFVKATPVELSMASQERESLPIDLYVGRLEREKGIPYLIKALSLAKALCQLMVVGDGTLKGEYGALAHRLGVGDRITFAGWLSRPALEKLYKQSRMLAFPSIWPEPFGLTGPEAMAFGTPVVAFAVGGVLDWLEDGRNGFLVEPKNSAQLAQKMDVLLQDRMLAQRMGEYGRQQVARKYSVDHHIKCLLEVFQGVTKSQWMC